MLLVNFFRFTLPQKNLKFLVAEKGSETILVLHIKSKCLCRWHLYFAMLSFLGNTLSLKDYMFRKDATIRVKMTIHQIAVSSIIFVFPSLMSMFSALVLTLLASSHIHYSAQKQLIHNYTDCFLDDIHQLMSN